MGDPRMTCVFIQLQCQPGKTYEIADEIYEREIVSEMYSTSGEFDLMIKLYVPDGEDVGKFIHANITNVSGIQRSLTTMTYQAF
jgi:DNA-binding Lrp family transcriptional regulator